jgi:isoquinoline 1-oxidoreductase alpha subunit
MATITLAVNGIERVVEVSPDTPLLWVLRDSKVSQCGYCQAGQIMTAAAFLVKNPQPSDAEIDTMMSSNLCRCGTYLRIRQAIQRAARELERHENKHKYIYK